MPLIVIDDPAAGYVSRGALKLAAALDHFGYDPAGRVALDIGASTGGFTQVLIERDAARVFAIDVGHGQLDGRIAADPRVTLCEGLNVRDLVATDIAGPVGAIVADVSFISLKLALPPALALASPAPGAFSWSSRSSRSVAASSASAASSAMAMPRARRPRRSPPGSPASPAGASTG